MKSPESTQTVMVPLADQGAMECAERGGYDDQGKLTDAEQAVMPDAPKDRWDEFLRACFLVGAKYDGNSEGPYRHLPGELASAMILMGFEDALVAVRQGVRSRKRTGELQSKIRSGDLWKTSPVNY